MKKTIVWDIDDTLQDFTYRWFKHYIQVQNAKFKKNKLEYEDLTENPPHNILNCTKEEYLKSIDSFAEHHYELLIPNIEILSWFKKYGDNFNHIVLTSCPLYRANISFRWVLIWFGRWIRSCNIVPSFRQYDCINYSKEGTKADFLKQFKQVDYFIDDNKKNCNEIKIEFPETKVYCINKPWNNSSLTVSDILKELN